MGKWMRRIRGAFGMGVAWGLAWFAAGMVLLLVVGPDAADVPFPLGFGLLGFLAGALFSVILGLVERGRGFHQLSLPRFAGWGAAGGLLFSVLFVVTVTLTGAGALLDDLVYLGPLFAAAGAASAGGALALARRADDRPSRSDGLTLPNHDGAGRQVVRGPAVRMEDRDDEIEHHEQPHGGEEEGGRRGQALNVGRPAGDEP